jgi:hypothetical protein
MTLENTHFNATKLLKEILKQHKKLQVRVSHFEDLVELPQDILNQKVTREGCKGGTWLPNELLQHYQEWLKSVGTRSGLAGSRRESLCSRHKDVV